jgi:hypothetical protein
LTGLWVLADKFLLPKLQNLALGAIDRTRIKTARSKTHCIDRIWEDTATDSPLRRYIVDICARRLAVGCLAKYPDQFPKEMLLQLIIAKDEPIDAQEERTKAIVRTDYYCASR